MKPWGRWIALAMLLAVAAMAAASAASLSAQERAELLSEALQRSEAQAMDLGIKACRDGAKQGDDTAIYALLVIADGRDMLLGYSDGIFEALREEGYAGVYAHAQRTLGMGTLREAARVSRELPQAWMYCASLRTDEGAQAAQRHTRQWAQRAGVPPNGRSPGGE